jgi:hypothetical protein
MASGAGGGDRITSSSMMFVCRFKPEILRIRAGMGEDVI